MLHEHSFPDGVRLSSVFLSLLSVFLSDRFLLNVKLSQPLLAS